MPNQKGSSPITIILIIITLLSLTLSSYLLLTKNQGVSPNAPTPTATPATTQPATDLTANWQTYNSSDLSFKYPANWVRSDNLTITSVSPKIRLVIIPKDGTLMNECMKKTSTEIKKDYTLRKFQRVTTGAMCAIQDPTSKEAWIMPSPSTYSPGVLYDYSSTETTEAESLLDQILATFKFLPSTNPSIQPSPVNLLPTTDWITAKNINFSLKYAPKTYNPIVKENYIQLKPKGNADNDFSKSPDFLLANDYNGGSRREWYLNHYSYSPSDTGVNVFFTEKTLGAIGALEVRLKGETETREILVSSNNKLIDILVQGANLKEVETMVSTLRIF